MGHREESNGLVIRGAAGELARLPISTSAVAVLARAGGNATFAAEEFFKATLNNEHTRRAYGRIVGRFLVWLDGQGIDLHRVMPRIAGEYIEAREGFVISSGA